MIGEAKQILYYVHNMDAVTAFYRDVMGLKPIFDPKTPPPEWIEFNAGAVRIALQLAFDPAGVASTHGRVVFHADDIAEAREYLVGRGAEMSEVTTSGEVQFCDGEDPEGNGFRISNR